MSPNNTRPHSECRQRVLDNCLKVNGSGRPVTNVVTETRPETEIPYVSVLCPHGNEHFIAMTITP